MKIKVRVKPNSKKESVEKSGENEYIARVNCPPIEGRANKRMIELLSEHFNVPKNCIAIAAGHKARVKIVSLL